jgi:hypothetical protein
MALTGRAYSDPVLWPSVLAELQMGKALEIKLPIPKENTQQLKRSLQRLYDDQELGYDLVLDQTLLNWGSGGRLGKPKILAPDIMTSLETIFNVIVNRFPDIELSLLDLFHGHILREPMSDNILIVFHSKEYPSDLTPYKIPLAQKLDPGIKTFRSNQLGFAKRNLIASLNERTIWRLDTTRLDFAHLRGSHTASNTLDETLLGEPICDINYLLVGRKKILYLY